MNDLAKLKWQCRRGMKELDLLLEHYLTQHYPTADVAEQARFIELLQLEDDELFKILLSHDLYQSSKGNSF